jgi:simple sugar transport system ATP-binding protein
MAPALRMVGIRKAFPGVVANDGAELEVKKGEIHALLGENGAGKSTLMNVLCGIYRPDAGEIWLEGEKVSIGSPHDAHHLGIALVRQRFALAPNLTVAENVFLGHSSCFFRPRTVARRLEEIGRHLGLMVAPAARASSLPPGLQQRVELLKALRGRARLLALDEPTSVLTPPETAALFRTLRRLAGEGCSVILITHKIQEALEVCERVTVLRAGKRVMQCPVSDTSRGALVRAMLGREAPIQSLEKEAPQPTPALVAENLVVFGDHNREAVSGASFSVRRGEILCLLGVSGNGQQELFQALSGTRRVAMGRVLMEGEDVTGAAPRRLGELGVAIVPSDRTGLVPAMSCEENLLLKDYSRRPYSRLGFLRRAPAQARARELMAAYGVEPPNPAAAVLSLSGGNQQRLLLARELGRAPRVILADQPTRGLDVRSTDDARRRIVQRARSGSAVLWITAEPEEALAVAHRISVICKGKLSPAVEAARADMAELSLLMAGAA